MNKKFLTRIIQLTLAMIFVSFSLDGAFTVTAKAEKSALAPISSVSSQIRLPSSPSPTIGLTDPDKNPSVINETSSSVTLELVTPDFTVETSQVEGQPCQVFHVAGYTEPEKAGVPRLPEKGSMVGIPQNAAPVLTLLETEPAEVEGRFNICPVSHPVIEYGPAGEIEYQGEAASRDLEVYNQNTLIPSSPAELTATAFIRSQRVAQVLFQPFQYNPVTGQARYFKRLRVRIDFGVSDASSAGPSKSKNEGAFENILSNSVANYTTATDYRQASLVSLGEPSSSIEGMQAKLFVNQSGMTAVTYAELAATGLNLSGVAAGTLQVFNRGVEIAIQVLGGEDGSFDPGDQIVFYGQSLDQKYTDANVYWLTWGRASGKRMTTLSAAPDKSRTSAGYLAEKHIELNMTYYPGAGDSRGDHWYWAFLVGTTTPVSASFDFVLANPDLSTSKQARLRGSLMSYFATPMHHTRVYVNEHLALDQFWNSGMQKDFDVAIPTNYLIAGTNTLRVEAPMDNGITLDRVLVNWFNLSYWRAYVAEQDALTFIGETNGDFLYEVNGFTSAPVDLYDISDPITPVQLSGASLQPVSGGYQLVFHSATQSQHRFTALAKAQYVTPQVVKEKSSSLKSTANAADYLLITAGEFATAVQPLADWRSNQGMRVQLIDVQDIYDEFNDGVVDPDAIRDFIAFAYQNWQPPAPQYVLLVGDGNHDPRNYSGTNERNFIPAYLEDVDPQIHETASDNLYVTVSGTDYLPDLMIGRLPVKTEAEASALVAKIIRYEQTPYVNDWNDDVLFVTDNPDTGGNFYAYSDRLVNEYLPDGYTPSKIYYGSTHTLVNEARAAVLASINSGDLLVNYVGHGAQTYWAAENLLSTSSITSLTNTGRPPLFSMLACLTGYFTTPSAAGTDNSSIAEVMMKDPTKGGIASWGSTGLGIAAGQDILNRGLFQAIFYDGQTRLGEATLQAKLYLASQSTYYVDLQNTYTLFGDPALKLNVRPSDLAVNLQASSTNGLLNGSPITYTLTYENEGLAEASRIRIDHPLPDILSNPIVSYSDASMAQIQNSRLSWELEKLSPGEGGVIVVTGIVDATGPTTISTLASIESPIPDANPNNNVAGPVQTVIIDEHPTASVFQEAHAFVSPGIITLNWETANEIALIGFNLYRSNHANELGARLNQTLILAANTMTPIGAVYSYQDRDVSAGQTYYYTIEIVETYGSLTYSLQQTMPENFIFLPLAWNTSQ